MTPLGIVLAKGAVTSFLAQTSKRRSLFGVTSVPVSGKRWSRLDNTVEVGIGVVWQASMNCDCMMACVAILLKAQTPHPATTSGFGAVPHPATASRSSFGAARDAFCGH